MNMVAFRSAPEQSERFSIRRRLGAGGFGVVYEAIDLRYGSTVALKVLYQDDPDALLRFKQEFRVLADITHPNLVMLHELLYERNQWLLSMEFIEGVHFLDALAPGAWSTPTVRLQMDEAREDGGVERSAVPLLDERRLRAAFFHLIQGVRALHAANILHLDLKPSNVLVTPTDRVVILDFGLAKELSPRHPGDLARAREGIAGTPAYMAPERILREPEGEASDWYSVGVMLYEALTGQPPFQGSVMQVLHEKLFASPMPPSQLSNHIPGDLEDLCLSLLRRDPKARPSGEVIALRLCQPHGPVELSARRQDGASSQRELLGRDREMAALSEAFQESRRGRAVLVRIAGLSGMGKSALASAFLTTLHRREGACVLMGRCHDRESVPYKALDSLVDALTRYIERLSPDEARTLIPQDIHDLIRLFPVLETIAGDPQGAERAEEVSPVEARWRAFHALKEMLRRLATTRPLVLCIDDLQWGDVDSAQLLFELLSPPEAPPLLLLACYRSDEADRSAFVREFSRLLSRSKIPIVTRDVTVGPLPYERALALARERLRPVVDEAMAEAIARESEGNPFSIEELARYVETGGGIGEGAQSAVESGSLTLRRAIQERLRATAESSRRLLEIVAVAGRPLELNVAFDAAELGANALACFTPLRSGKLLRVCSVHESPGCEVLHERLRDALIAALRPEALVARHRRLASVLEASEHAEPEELAMHFHSAGERYKAARYAASAGDRASHALAFDHAAQLYAFALEWARGGPDDTLEARHSMEVRRAHALANAGRCHEGAELYLQCAAGAPRDEALDLRRRAIEQFFVGGHLDEGNRVLAPFLAEVGLRHPKTTASAALMALTGLIHVRRRGYGFRVRPAVAIAPELLTQIDVCSAVSIALTDVDPLRSFAFQLRSLRLALEAGEPSRIAHGLGTFAQLSLLQGTPATLKTGERLLAQAEQIARESGDAQLREAVAIYQASSLMIEGRWRAALERYDEIRRYLRSRRDSLAMYHNMAQVVAVIALDAMGNLDQLAERTAAWHREATAVGNLFAAISASIASAVTLIAADDEEGARARVRQGVASWTRGGMHVQHMYALRIEVYADLYEGRSAAARARVARAWNAIVRSQQLRVQPARIDMLFLRARTAIASAYTGVGQRAWLTREVERIARRLEREIRRDARPSAALLRAAVAQLRGRQDLALTYLETAIDAFDAAEMSLYAACARRRKGEMLGGEDGRAMVIVADAIMAQQGIRRPERWVEIFAPGLGAGVSDDGRGNA